MAVVRPFAVSKPAVLDGFRRDLGHAWHQVAPFCIESDERPLLLRDTASAPHLIGELEALLAGWDHYDTDQRAVLAGAVAVVTGAATVPQGVGPGTRVDGDLVVDAAVRAILRGR